MNALDMRFEYIPVSEWPVLAWLAVCRHGDPTVRVYCGGRVERHAEWFCEATWAGDYEAGGLDRTDLVFGSGARLRDGVVIFVSAGSTTDRLHSHSDSEATWISNSLPCLLKALDADVDPTYGSYVYDFRSICRGVGRYDDVLATSVGSVRLTYFDNLVWNGTELVRAEKPAPRRRVDSFDSYVSFLNRSIESIAQNLSASGRTFPYSMISTMSAGYDSPAVVVLAREHGLRETIAFASNWLGVPDSGEDVSLCLGIPLKVVERRCWHDDPQAAVPFLAADANGGDIDMKCFEDMLLGRVLLTGHMGYMVWQKRVAGPDDHRIVRKDHAGLSLTEYRLWAGFIHFPVPVIGVRQIIGITAIGRSNEMAPWDVGGAYNRPIPRRIVEGAGVPRGAFAVEKSGVSTRLSEPDVFWSGKHMEGYLEWLDQNTWLWVRRGRIPPRVIGAFARPWQRLARKLARHVPGVSTWPRLSRRLAKRLEFFGSREYLYKFAFPWAIARAKERYSMPWVFDNIGEQSAGPRSNEHSGDSTVDMYP